MSDSKHVVLIHGSWSRGEQWAPARAAFEERGCAAHTPTLRHHGLPLHDGASKIPPLSLRDYTDDLVALIASLDSPPLLAGHSLGGLVAQLVAPRTHHAGMIAACPSAVGPAGLNPTALGISLRHALQLRPWAKPVYPPTWERFWPAVASSQTEEVAREVFDDLVCESGRVLFFELAMPWLDRTKAARVDFGAARYRNATYVEIPGSDHMVFYGDALSITMGHIDDWIARNNVLSTA